MEKYKKGLKRLYENKIVRDYLNGVIVGGYLDHENRTLETDEVLEELLKIDFLKEAITEKDIAMWMCSKTARHFMDDCDTLKDFNEGIVESIIYSNRFLWGETEEYATLNVFENLKLSKETEKNVIKTAEKIQSDYLSYLNKKNSV